MMSEVIHRTLIIIGMFSVTIIGFFMYIYHFMSYRYMKYEFSKEDKKKSENEKEKKDK